MDVCSLSSRNYRICSRAGTRPSLPPITGTMGSHPRVTQCGPNELHLDALPPDTQKAFIKASSFPLLNSESWYLAGGTALALQAGHRQSVDLDFFTTDATFDTAKLERSLLQESGGEWATTSSDDGTLYGLLCGAKASFIAYPFFQPASNSLRCGTIRILSPDDIAVMKIIAISQRGKKRDFLDLFWYCSVHGGSLCDTILRAKEQYPNTEHNMPHLIKSLSYFDDAEDDPMPRLNFDADWEGVKEFFRTEVTVVAKELLGIT